MPGWPPGTKNNNSVEQFKSGDQTLTRVNGVTRNDYGQESAELAQEVLQYQGANDKDYMNNFFNEKYGTNMSTADRARQQATYREQEQQRGSKGKVAEDSTLGKRLRQGQTGPGGEQQKFHSRGGGNNRSNSSSGFEQAVSSQQKQGQKDSLNAFTNGMGY